MIKRKNLIAESGAIMLEVVAVLSLMGLMGTMLFRQMYVRNQELHNIQMASEIRVVKDAFAAWIQAESSHLGAYCDAPTVGNSANVCSFDGNNNVLDNIASFLPEGYFSNEAGVVQKGEVMTDNYHLYLVSYYRGTAGSEILTYYGVVVPDNNLLPDEGVDTSTWNFRRAARVAMLIGVDGGAYDSNITGNDIAGAVGTWHLDADGLIAEEDDVPKYVAITGTDVFQPELDIPAVKIGLENDWDLALHDATAYGKFTAGAPAGCYRRTTINGRREARYNDANDVFEIRSDTINAPSAECLPAFYVESGVENDAATGNVHVLNDLTVGRDWTGADAGKAAIRFDKDGMIVFEKAEVADPQNSGTAGAPNKVNYVLDPKYTSVMNDIKLMSRGGANLSDILPNYILKEQQELSCTIIATSDPNGHPTTECSKDVGCSCTMNTGIEYPKCPKGYLQSLVLIPQRFGGAHDYSAHLISSYYVGAAKNANTTLSLSSGTVRNPGRILEYADVFQLALSFTDCKKNGSATNNAWCPKATYYGIYNHDNGDSDRTSMLRENETINVLAQTYCVFDPTQIDWNSDGTVAGTDSSPTKTRPMDDTICGRIKTEDVCVNMGCRWDDGACTGIAPSP